jgi:hypothetical protein
VTLFDVYECAINPDKLEMKIKDGERLFLTQEYVLVPDAEYIGRQRELLKFGFDRDASTSEMKAAISVELLRHLDQNHIPYSIVTETGGDAAAATPDLARKREQLEAVKRWFYHDWCRIEPKLRTSIVEGISVFLSLFDDNPSVKATFCPPKECYDPELNHDGREGVPMPPFSQLLEQGKVCALNFPVAMNPGLARTIGTLMKQDFQRAVLNRIPLRSLNQLNAGGKSSFFAMSIKASPQWGRVIRRATRSSSRCRGKPSAFRLSPRSLSALCARPCRASRGGLCCKRSEPRSSWH